MPDSSKAQLDEALSISPLRRSPRKHKPVSYIETNDRPTPLQRDWYQQQFDLTASRSPGTVFRQSLERFEGPSVPQARSPVNVYARSPTRSSVPSDHDIPSRRSFVNFPSSPVEMRLDWGENDQLGSTPNWRQLLFPELPDEEDPEYNPEELDEEDDEEDDDEEEAESVADGEHGEQPHLESEFDLQELLRDAQEDLVLPKPLTELLHEDDDDDTEYEPDEDDEVHEDDDDDDDDDDNETFQYDPSEFDLEELLRDAQQDVPVLPKPLTELMEDMTSDDEEYNPEDNGDDDDEEEEDEEEEQVDYDPLDFDLEALLRDAQQEPLVNPYTPQGQQLMAVTPATHTSHVSHHSPELQHKPPPAAQSTVDESTLSVKELLVVRREKIQQERKQKKEMEQKWKELSKARETPVIAHHQMGLMYNYPAVLERKLQQAPIIQHPRPLALVSSTESTPPLVTANVENPRPYSKVSFVEDKREENAELKSYRVDKAPHNAGTTTRDIGVEERCNWCDRVFRGPRASTHKQQHIKRLHPEHYVKKKGGKRPHIPGQYLTMY